MPWLYDILRNGTLVDNQTYLARNEALDNRRWPEPKRLEKAARRTQPRHKEWDIWQFLVQTSQEVSESLRSRPMDSLVLFNDGDYEHNTTDDFVTLHGSDAFNFQLTTGNLIGCVKRGDYSIRISSRFGDAFLRYIIADADGFLELEDFGGEQPGGDYDWLLAYLWMIKLKRAFRLGLPKNYVGRTETTCRVRGRLDPVRFYTNGDRASYHCSYREHSYCNPQTVLIAEAFRTLKSHPLLPAIHTVASNFTVAAEGLRPGRRQLLGTRKFSNPFYSDYNGVIDLSKRVLQNESTDFGSQSQTSAFFFDVSMLFEYFVRKLLKRAGAHIHPKAMGLTIPSGGLRNSRRKLEPDLVFELGNKACLFDVKYKSYDFETGVSREDLFQLHTYVGQWSNNLQLTACGLIYPVMHNKWEANQLGKTGGVICDTLEVCGKRIPFSVSFIRVPNADDLDFGPSFKQSSELFVNKLRSAVLN